MEKNSFIVYNFLLKQILKRTSVPSYDTTSQVEPWVSQKRGPHQVISLQHVPGRSGLLSLFLTIYVYIWLRAVFDAILGGLSPKGSVFV